MTSKKKQIEIKKRRIDWGIVIGSLLFVLIFIYIIGLITWGLAASYMLDNNYKYVKGIVIGERNYTGHSPVANRYYFSYKFSVNNKEYKGNTLHTKYHIGDSVIIKYVPVFPRFNEIIGK